MKSLNYFVVIIFLLPQLLFSQVVDTKAQKILDETYAKIQNKQFFPGCQKPECVWCNFYTSGALIQNDDIEES